MSTTIDLDGSSGAGDGYRRNFLLERDLESPIVVNAARLGLSHPMFLVRLRLFVDWHLAAGHDVSVTPPAQPDVLQQWGDMRLADGWPADTIVALPEPHPRTHSILAIHRLRTFHDVEDAAAAAAELLGHQAPELARWGEAAHMAISELCDNAIQHGTNELGAYVVADRTIDPQPCFRMAIADLGIGIPEHIRARHPEWQDDNAAISRVLDRGVTGTGDPHRGNGYAEVLDLAHAAQLQRAQSALSLDIRSAKGRVEVALVDGTMRPTPLDTQPRRGTWISYEITTVG